MYIERLAFIFILFLSTTLFAAGDFNCTNSTKKISIVGTIGSGDSLLGPVYVYNYELAEAHQLSEFRVSHFWIDYKGGEIRLKAYDVMEDKDKVVLVVDRRVGKVSLDYRVELSSEGQLPTDPLQVKIDNLDVICNF